MPRILSLIHILPAYDAAQEESAGAGDSSLDGNDYTSDGSVVPQYSVGAEIAEIDGSGADHWWNQLFDKSDSCLLYTSRCV